jgi:ribonucleoside-diphosphate reductase alpha chain
MLASVGPRLAYSDQLHAEKYRLKGETFRDAMGRVASALQDSPAHYHAFRDVLLDMRFMPAGRVQAAMGSPKGVTPYNCYVSGTIPDSFVSRENSEQSSIMHRAEQAATTMRMGGGIGYDFSTLRPKGFLIKKLLSQSSGPLGFMPIFNEVCKATSSAGNRRGAQMGVLRIDHPDIFEFISAKHNSNALTGFNISIGVTDEFMECLAARKPFALRFEGQVIRHVDPEDLWEAVMRSTWDWAEPGVLFIDRINGMNNLWYCETIAATNPCGEQPLPPFGACLLGSYNLVKYLRPVTSRIPSKAWSFDWDQLKADIPHVTRAMDNVVDRAIYPLMEQMLEAKNKRRMGMGVTGLANAAEAMGLPYGSRSFLEFEDRLLAFITRHTYLASAELAKEKGSFPLYDEEKYLAGKFVSSLDEEVRDAIRRNGIRNSHLTSIAPTGTISMAADNVSSSIEPVYRFQQERTVLMAEGRRTVDLFDYGFGTLHVRGRRTSMGEVTAAEHVSVLTTAQKHVDSAVSKTVNCDGSMPWADFKGIYLSAYENGAKGCTTFNKDGKRAGLFKETPEPADLPFPGENSLAMVGISDDVGGTCEFDPATGRRSCE